MFTGIIEEIGTVRTIRKGTSAIQLTILAPLITSDIKTGDSINTNGVCLTVTSFNAETFEADVMPETMSRTGFSQLQTGSRVNLERAVRLSDRLGGHLVSGHIDGTGKLTDTRKDENAIWMTVSADPSIIRYVAEKGSVALDGVSLTVAKVNSTSFQVSVIPHTQSETTLTSRRRGELINIECDIIGKYVEKLFTPGSKDRIDLEFLAKNDFI